MKESPPELWTAVWRLLGRATADKKHAYATPSMATVSRRPALGEHDDLYIPRLRTVVLRAANRHERLLTAYTDRRSQKVEDLRSLNQYLAWCFWDKRSQIQFTGYGPTQIVTSEESGRIFDSLPKHSRKAYATLSAPGHNLADNQATALPQDWSDLSLRDTAYARDNFCVLRTELRAAEVLRLSRSGHERLRAKYEVGAAKWEFNWVVP